MSPGQAHHYAFEALEPIQHKSTPRRTCRSERGRGEVGKKHERGSDLHLSPSLALVCLANEMAVGLLLVRVREWLNRHLESSVAGGHPRAEILQ